MKVKDKPLTGLSFQQPRQVKRREADISRDDIQIEIGIAEASVDEAQGPVDLQMTGSSRWLGRDRLGDRSRVTGKQMSEVALPGPWRYGRRRKRKERLRCFRIFIHMMNARNPAQRLSKEGPQKTLIDDRDVCRHVVEQSPDFRDEYSSIGAAGAVANQPASSDRR
jgi:hypothetical protein